MENVGWVFWAASVMKLPSCGVLVVGFLERSRAICDPGSWPGEERIQAAGAVEGGQVVVTADMACAHVDLRHGAPAGPFHHFLAPFGLEVDAHLFDLGHALGLE